MSYYCNICDFNTHKKYNYNMHIKSESHKTKQFDENIINNKIDKITIEIKNKYENKIIKLEKELKKYKKKYHNVIEKNNNELSNIVKLALKNNNKALETTTQVTKTTKKSISAINYLIKNHSNNKSFYSYNLDTISNYDLAMIASDPKHMSKVLVNTFIDTNLINASVRCVDATRLKFTLKSEDSWIIDTNGEIIKEKVIKPLTEKAYKFINDKMKHIIAIHGNNISTDEIIKYQKGIENIKKLGEDIMQNKILKKFGSKCMIDRSQLLL
jgi:hypothetical protein